MGGVAWREWMIALARTATGEVVVPPAAMDAAAARIAELGRPRFALLDAACGGRDGDARGKRRNVSIALFEPSYFDQPCFDSSRERSESNAAGILPPGGARAGC